MSENNLLQKDCIFNVAQAWTLFVCTCFSFHWNIKSRCIFHDLNDVFIHMNNGMFWLTVESLYFVSIDHNWGDKSVYCLPVYQKTSHYIVESFQNRKLITACCSLLGVSTHRQKRSKVMQRCEAGLFSGCCENGNGRDSWQNESFYPR